MTKQQTTAQKVKAAIKAAGIDTKKISVTTSYPGYEEVIRVVIKDAAIDINAVEQIAHRFQEVEYDERCQEILQGGNTFVRVRYDYDILDAAIKALEPLAADAIKRISTKSAGIRVKVAAPNGLIMEILTFANSDHWTVYNENCGVNDIDHRASVRPSDYYPEYFPHALARIFFNLGARYVDNIPDPEPDPEPEPERPDYYIIAAGIDSFTGYRVEAAAPDAETARKAAAECRITDITFGASAPVYYICTRSEVLARVDDNGYHAPKGKPQRTPRKILITIDAWELHNQ